MSACYRLVLDSVCRSNHHRLAILALQHLQAEGAEDWRNVFLKHRDEYLEGAKAPDEVFKDFRNHVLHVRENDWGGAREAAREWYRRTVRAMREQDWSHAAYCAGVMSHYVVDPLQPFHTGQTEEEGVIHRAVEWSFYKAFPELLEIIENDLGWPNVPTPEGDDWLERMIRAGALIANTRYESVIDHYDFEAGRSRPAEGLDQELKDIIAALMAYAAVMLARVLDRAIAEAKAEAPQVGLLADTVAIWASQPRRAIAKRAADVEERGLIEEQYTEYRRTGKVRQTMAEDDRIVRRLHAEEVLKIPLATLDCQWPRETGTKSGQGAAPRAQGRRRKVEAAAPPPVAAPQVAALPPEKVKPAKSASSKPVEQKIAEPASAAPAARASAARLTREDAVVDAPSIGPKTAGRLNVIGVKTVGDLLALSAEEAAAQIKQSHINARIIKDWQAQALLACSVPELSGTQAQLLVGAGVTSLEDLAAADPDTLNDAIGLFAASSEGEHALRGQKAPDRARIASWIAAATAAPSRSAA